MAGAYIDGLDAHGQWEASTGNAALERHGAIVDLGQVPGWMKKQLDAAARSGRLVKYRGYWDTLLTFSGLGPLKTIWAEPELAEALGLSPGQSTTLTRSLKSGAEREPGPEPQAPVSEAGARTPNPQEPSP